MRAQKSVSGRDHLRRQRRQEIRGRRRGGEINRSIRDPPRLASACAGGAGAYTDHDRQDHESGACAGGAASYPFTPPPPKPLTTQPIPTTIDKIMKAECAQEGPGPIL